MGPRSFPTGRLVTARIPVRPNRDDRYFGDTYQAMPRRRIYTRMFENMLDHPNITVVLNTDYRDLLRSVRYKKWSTRAPWMNISNIALENCLIDR